MRKTHQIQICLRRRNNNQYQLSASKMGTCAQTCCKSEQAKDVDYSMIILPNYSLSSIDLDRKRTLSTNESQDDPHYSNQSEHYQTAVNQYNLGNYQESINEFMLALHKICKTQSTFPFVHYYISKCYRMLKKEKEGFQHCKIAYEKYKALGISQSYARCAQFLGELKICEEDSILGIYYYEKALQTYKQEENEPKIMEVMYTLGIIYMDLQEYDKVVQLYHKLQQIQRPQRRIQKQHIFRINFCLAKIYSYKANFQKSISYFAKCLQMVFQSSCEYQQACRQFSQMNRRLKQVLSKREQLRLQNIMQNEAVLVKLLQA